MVNNGLFICNCKAKKELILKAFNLLYVSQLHQQMYLILHSYMLITTKKKIKCNWAQMYPCLWKKVTVQQLCYLIQCVFQLRYITWWSAPAGRIIASPRNWITVQVFTPYSSKSLWRSFLFTYQLWSRIGSCSGKTSRPCSFAICKYRKDPRSLPKELNLLLINFNYTHLAKQCHSVLDTQTRTLARDSKQPPRIWEVSLNWRHLQHSHSKMQTFKELSTIIYQ